MKRHSSFKVKSSFGIACCRVNGKKEVEILLVCKRYTYAYCEFVNFNYNINSDNDIVNLFKKMTLDEKIDILSLNYQQMWYRIWTNNSNYQLFAQKKNQFDAVYMCDGGVRLRKLISQTLSTNADRIWEIPKGRRDDKTESNLVCAIREFYEETGIKKRFYTLLHEVGFNNNYTEGGVMYKNKYFLARAQDNLDIKKFITINQLNEISDMRWMSYSKIKAIDNSNRLLPLCRVLFKKYKTLIGMRSSPASLHK